MSENISFPLDNTMDEIIILDKLELIKTKSDGVKLTAKGKRICAKYNNYFRVAKKRTTAQLLGKGYMEMLNIYREAWPAGKLPSGKPGRQNVKTLENAFRWFFEVYDYTWEEIAHATVLYINQYKEKDYKYMKTSQYFICKQDKNKVKHSELADYCDMIRDGVTEIKNDHFKEKVV